MVYIGKYIGKTPKKQLFPYALPELATRAIESILCILHQQAFILPLVASSGNTCENSGLFPFHVFNIFRLDK